MLRSSFAWLLGCLILDCFSPCVRGEEPTSLRREHPRLVLFVTVDQLRGDMPLRFEDRFGDGGFRYLMQQGAIYTQAFYRHSTTFTAVGHATLFTGADAAQHGIVGNDWYDAQTRQKVYCVEDETRVLLGQPTPAHEGTSPRNLTMNTIGDELQAATGRQSRVFSVSLKDRGAIIPGGHQGKAFWYGKSTGRFITSNYYYEAYPEWVEGWNSVGHADRYKDGQWDLLNDRSTYLSASRDDCPYERSYKLLGRTFPHPLQNPQSSDYYATLQCTPMGDELTIDFALELLRQEKLGQGPSTDMLMVGLSATDYIGHAFGPDSLEAEDNLMRLDRSLARLFGEVDRLIGLKQVLIVLSSDHGISSIPEYAQSIGLAAGRLNPVKLMICLNDCLQQRYQTDRNLVLAFANPAFYLDRQAILELNLDLVEVERRVSEELLTQPGIAYAVTRTDLLAAQPTSDSILQKVQHSFHPHLSGHVIVVQQPVWFLYSDPEAYSAMHGSPYPYDTYVPIMLAGSGIAARRIERMVGPQDIAPTVAAILGIDPPKGCTGTLLAEVLGE